MNHFGGRGSIAQDDVKGKIYDRRLYGKMLRYLKPYMPMVIVSFLILMMITGAEVIIPLITRKAIDEYIVSNKTIAVFDDLSEADSFATRYKNLKLKTYQANSQAFIILTTADVNKIDAKDILKLKSDSKLSPINIYLLNDSDSNRSILNKYLSQNTTVRIGKDGISGWFELGEGKLAVCQSKLAKISKKELITLRSEAAHHLLILALIYFSIIFIRLLSGYSQSVLTATFSQRAMNDLRHDVFAHLQKMPTKFFDQNPVGRLVTRVTNDIRTIDEMLASGVITIVQDVILIIAIVVLMLILNWKLALVSFTILPFVILTIQIYKTKTRVVYREVRKHLAALNATLAEHIAGQKIIQLFNQYFHKRDEFAEINHQYFKTSLDQLKLFAFFRPIIHVSSQIAVAMIIWYGGGQILRNMITIGLLMAFTAYIQKLFEPINDFSEKFNLLQSALAGAERIFDLMEQAPEEYRNELASSQKLRGEIEFENLWLTYNDEEWVLKDVAQSFMGIDNPLSAFNDEEWVLKDLSFKVKAGEKIALVGHTGSGKTSIVNLILGMYPFQRGNIRLDDKSISSYALSDIRRNIGIVQQDVFIFSGNVRDNIALNNKGLSDAKIKEVATYVNADRFISKLPHAYDEPVMERGATLSTGQRQLIAFARVLAYDPSIFVLDEATSNIDTETEILIQDALHKIMDNRTSIIIAHRLSTIQHVDRILVLHKGEIAEEGTHDSLLAKKGLYYDLYRLQYT